jgi:hypothetical protein
MEKITLPLNSILKNWSSDYSDCFVFEIKDPNDVIKLSDIGNEFVKPGPKWVDSLFKIRNSIAAKFNLKTPDNTGDLPNIENKEWKIGDQVGIFKLFDKSENELIMGEDDSHLCFRVSVYLDSTNSDVKLVYVSTLVKYNNLLGKIYFAFVGPFHRLIVPTIMKRNFKKFEFELANKI